jgi:hypothetical protein
MESKENIKPCEVETGSVGNPEGGQETGEGNAGLQPGPFPSQAPFPYGYFQSPNLQPGYYMSQGGSPQGQMPGYWVMPVYGASPPYMNPGPAPQQEAGQPQPANPGNMAAQYPPEAAGGRDNGGLQAHDAPATTGGQDNAGCGTGDTDGGHAFSPGHHKEPGHDELRDGTYMDSPGNEAFNQAPETTGDIPAPSWLSSFFQFDNDSLATMLLTNSTVKKGIMKTVIKASASVKGGVEELKEQLGDLEAEVLHELNEKKK